jgi:iron-sulfur cluster insertion protein
VGVGSSRDVSTVRCGDFTRVFCLIMIIFADAAALKVKEILELNPDYNSALDTNLNLRVLISGGGCSGFKYGFSLDEKKEDGDVVVENQGVKLVVDPISALYLDGAKIDYIESFESSHFEIRNPNVTSTCGCGSSFAV